MAIKKQVLKGEDEVTGKQQLTDETSEYLELSDNMQARATAKTIRISARKVRLVLDLIRGRAVDEALAILHHTPKAASPVVIKLLLSAMANAENNYEMDVENLYVAEVYANEGPTLKRFRPRAQGRASSIHKRTSHITIVVKELKRR